MSKDGIEIKIVNGFDPSKVTEAGREALRKSLRDAQDKMFLNSAFGRFGRSIDPLKPIPVLWDHGEAIMPRMYPYWPTPPVREQVIPALEVPEAPREPEPVVEPESASVQMLRKLLADRRAELATAEQNCADTKVEIEDTKRMLADEEAELASHERHVAAAKASIEQVLADIKALGGRDEGDSIRG